MSAPRGNQFAAKGEADKASSFLHIRCTPSEKAAWVKASGGKLAPWVVAVLNARAAKK